MIKSKFCSAVLTIVFNDISKTNQRNITFYYRSQCRWEEARGTFNNNFKTGWN